MNMRSAEFVAVGAADEIADGTYAIIEAGGHSLLVANLAGAFFAVENRCSHAGSPLGGGRM